MSSRFSFRLSPLRNLSIEAAALCPATIAFTAISGPETTSPPAKIRFTLVANVSSSTEISPARVSNSPSAAFSNSQSTAWPMATTTESADIICSEPGLTIGLNLPSLSKTDRHSLNSTPATCEFRPTIRLGESRLWIRTPSSLAARISLREANISSGDSRQARCTSLTPRRITVRATSIATLPPPMTITLRPRSTRSPRLAALKRSVNPRTPFNSIPETGTSPVSVTRTALRSAKTPISASWLTAGITISASIMNLESGTGIGRLRPDSSGGPRVILTHSSAATLPPVPRIRVGEARKRNSISSSSQAFISSSLAGISSRVRRYRIVTRRAPRRKEVRAESMAAFPPPTTTTTLFAMSVGWPIFARCRNPVP